MNTYIYFKQRKNKHILLKVPTVVRTQMAAGPGLWLDVCIWAVQYTEQQTCINMQYRFILVPFNTATTFDFMLKHVTDIKNN